MQDSVGEGNPAKALSLTTGQEGGRQRGQWLKKARDLRAAGHAQPVWDLGLGCTDVTHEL